jgi:hypothetical protein
LKKYGSKSERPTNPIFHKNTKKGHVNDLDSPKTELWRRNPAKKSTKTQKHKKTNYGRQPLELRERGPAPPTPLPLAPSFQPSLLLTILPKPTSSLPTILYY